MLALERCAGMAEFRRDHCRDVVNVLRVASSPSSGVLTFPDWPSTPPLHSRSGLRDLMSDSFTVEIKFCDQQMVVFPSAKLINRRESARQISSDVSAALKRKGECPTTDVVMDLSDVGWISSAGINELIQLQTRSRAQGINFRLRATCDTVREVFRITRLERSFQFDSAPAEQLLERALAE